MIPFPGKSFWWLGLGCLLLLTSCKSRTVGEVLTELRSEKYVRTIEAGNHKLVFRYVPEALYYLAMASLDDSTIVDKKLLDSLKQNYPGQYGLMFSMTIAPKVDTLAPTDFRNDVVYGQLSGKSYQETLNDYLFGLKTKVWLEVDGKRYDMKNYHMTRSWGMTKSRTFTLLFGDIEDFEEKDLSSLTLVTESIVPGHGRERLSWRGQLVREGFKG